MYASAMRRIEDVMEDDHIKIGENGLLYRVSGIATVKDGEDEAVVLKLYHTGDETRKTVAILAMTPYTSVKVYNQ